MQTRRVAPLSLVLCSVVFLVALVTTSSQLSWVSGAGSAGIDVVLVLDRSGSMLADRGVRAYPKSRECGILHAIS